MHPRAWLAIPILALHLAAAEPPGCPLEKIQAGGESVVTRFFAASPVRVREVIADSMQAAGVVLFTNNERGIEGERVNERVLALGVPGGEEALTATVEPATADGARGATVSVETRRRGNKKGAPKQRWSAAVVDHAACLLALLSLDDPAHRPHTQLPDEHEIRFADGVPVVVRARRFTFNTDWKPHQPVYFETTGEGDLPAGLCVMAEGGLTSDIKELGEGARGALRFQYVVLPDRSRLPLRGDIALRGHSVSEATVAAAIIAFGAIGASLTGRGFAIPAGTLFRVQVAGEHTVKLPSQ